MYLQTSSTIYIYIIKIFLTSYEVAFEIWPYKQPENYSVLSLTLFLFSE